MGVKKRRVKKENGNEQGEGENVGGRIKFKGWGNQGWQLLKMVTKRANPKNSNTGAQVRFT